MVTESLWVPRSPCGPRCLPGPGTVPAAGPMLVAGRLLALLAVAVAVVAAIPLFLLPGRPAGHRVRSLAARCLLRALGVRHRRSGHLPRRAALVVTRHVSWLDVLVLMAYLPVRLVAKHEVRGWPVVGLLAKAAGTLFIDRSRPRALPATVRQVEDALKAGGLVAFFPEGTTWCGPDGGRFRPALFQSAVNAGAAVAPVTLGFRLADGANTTVTAFIGDDNLLASILRVVRCRGVHAGLHLHPALHPTAGASRRALADATQASVGWPVNRATAGRAVAA